MNIFTAKQMSMLIVALATVVPASLLKADTVVIGGVPLPNVRVQDIRDGQLYYSIRGRIQNKPLTDVQAIAMDSYPNLAKAETMLKNGQSMDAAKMYNVLRKETQNDQYLAVYINIRLVQSLDKAGLYEHAINGYMGVLSQNKSPFVLQAVPRNVKIADARKEALVKRIYSAWRVAVDPGMKGVLASIIEDLGGPPEGVELPDPGSDPAAAGIARPVKVPTDPNEAVKVLHEELNKPGAKLGYLFHELGRNYVKLGQDQDALICFMRVAIHFPRGRSRYSVPCLVEAGKIFAKVGETDKARALWTEADLFVGDDKTEAEIAKLLESIQ